MKIFTMRSFEPRPTVRLGIAWLFCLVLLLPMAQSAALWHGLSHGLEDSSARGDHKQGSLAGHCDLCLVAAAVSAGAPPGVPHAVPDPAARHALPLATWASVWLAAPTRAYRSRAPPHVPH